MREYLRFYIVGQWVDPVDVRVLDVENPATEQGGLGRPDGHEVGYYVRPPSSPTSAMT